MGPISDATRQLAATLHDRAQAEALDLADRASLRDLVLLTAYAESPFAPPKELRSKRTAEEVLADAVGKNTQGPLAGKDAEVRRVITDLKKDELLEKEDASGILRLSLAGGVLARARIAALSPPAAD